MCFPKSTERDKDIVPIFDEEGAINEPSNNELYIPEGIHEHIDSIYINFDFEDGILAFVYESSEGQFVIWTSQEAEAFSQLCSALNYPLFESN